MYPHSASGDVRSKKLRLPSWHFWLYWIGVLCALTAALAAFGVIHWPGGTNGSNDPLRINSDAQLRHSESVPGVHISQRRLYPYSVIPGGVRSAQELRSAIAHDPAVAELYANFDLSKARVVRLAKNREVYVSYRLGDRIYWTKERVLLRAGETVITDGKHEARTRCGNRMSETPVQPVAQNEPQNAAINSSPEVRLYAANSESPPDLPVVWQDPDPLAPNVPSIPQPPSSSPIYFIPPTDYPIVGGGPPSFPNVIPPPPPPVATPEPRAVSMLGLGLLVLATLAGASKLGNRRRS